MELKLLFKKEIITETIVKPEWKWKLSHCHKQTPSK